MYAKLSVSTRPARRRDQPAQGNEAMTAERYRSYIRDIPDFPKPGINFKDISPLLQDGGMFRKVVEHIADYCDDKELGVDMVAGPEGAIATEYGTGHYGEAIFFTDDSIEF